MKAVKYIHDCGIVHRGACFPAFGTVDLNTDGLILADSLLLLYSIFLTVSCCWFLAVCSMMASWYLAG